MIFFPIRWEQSSLAQDSALSHGSTCDFSILGLLGPSPSRPLVSYISGLQFHLVEMAMVPGGSDGDGDSVDFPGPVGEFRQGPLVCAFKGMGDALAGAVMGSVFGFGSGLFKKQGFKGALREGGSSAKTFALLSGVHSIVSCYLRRIRGVEDALNAGIAGCATGLALSTPGSPQALLQSCVSFGVFSYILESLNKPRAAMAATKVFTSRPLQQENFTQSMQALVPVLPPFTLPPFAGVFAQFCQSKPNDDQSRSS